MTKLTLSKLLPRKSCFGLVVVLAALTFSTTANADSLTIDAPSIDRWMYPFNGTPGTRANASVFGAPGNQPTFDDLDAQFLVAFDTSAIPTDRGAANYLVTNAALTLTISIGDGFNYDPTSDSYTTHLDPADPEFTADSDAGRPITLSGVSYRNGFTSSTFLENTAFAPAGPPASGVRSAYAADFDGGGLRDISNNVFQRFDPVFFAIGQTSGTVPGARVAGDTIFTFTIDLANPGVLGYVQTALNAGKLDLMATGLFDAAFGGAATYPQFYTKENALYQPGDTSLSLEYTIVPEPSSLLLVLASGLGLVATRRSRR